MLQMLMKLVAVRLVMSRCNTKTSLVLDENGLALELLPLLNGVLCYRRGGNLNRYNKNCLSGNIVMNLGLHPMWQPICKSRRQDDDLTNYKFPPDPGPPRRPEYDPTWGYEPYWQTGDWVFETGPWLKGKVCGHECPNFYIQFGKICGRSVSRESTIQHKTFDNYCEMQKIDCDGKKGWNIAYRGECREEIQTYPTRIQLLKSRAIFYMSSFYDKYPTTVRRTKKPKKDKG